nr:site-specific integrase [Mesorhizobium denitrificans]
MLKKKPGRYLAGDNLYLVVGKGNARSWAFIYTSPVTGKRREFGLGSEKGMTLAAARDEADELRPKIRKGFDPIEDKKSTKSQAKAGAKAITFGEYVDDWIKALETRKEKPLRPGTIRNMRGAMKNLSEAFTTKKIADISGEDVIAELKPIWARTPNVGVLVQNIMERVFDVARVEKKREGENPARWKANLKTLDHLFLKPDPHDPDKHHPAMPYKDISAWFAGNECDLLKFLVLTAARSTEARLAQWSELDLDQKIWTIPAARMKSKRQHKVPLTDAAVSIIERQTRTRSPFIFNGGKFAQAHLVKKIGVPGVTVHGFRSAFRDWALEQSDHSREIIEMSLAHAVGNKTERAYRRGDAIDKRRVLLQDWEKFVTSKVT